MRFLPLPPPPPLPELPGLDFALTGYLGTPPFPTYTASQLLDVIVRGFPAAYTDAMRQGGGYEIFQMIAAVAERVALAINRFIVGSFVGWAQLGSYATGSVEFYRTSTLGGAFTIRAGSIVESVTGGRRFVTQQDAVFSGGALGPIIVPCRAVAQGWEYNVDGQHITAGGETIPGEITKIVILLQEPPFTDHTIQVRNVNAFTGGAAAMLEQLGLDRGNAYVKGEEQEAYRARIQALPDTVTPYAVQRATFYYLSRFRLGYEYIETWQQTFVGFWDDPLDAVGTYHPATFVWDDPRTDRFRDRWLDELLVAGTILIVVSDIPCVDDGNWSFDDTGTVESDFSTIGWEDLGWRGSWNVFDVPDGIGTDFAFGAPSAPDVGRTAILGGLWDLLNRVKCGGTDIRLISASDV